MPFSVLCGGKAPNCWKHCLWFPFLSTFCTPRYFAWKKTLPSCEHVFSQLVSVKTGRQRIAKMFIVFLSCLCTGFSTTLSRNLFICALHGMHSCRPLWYELNYFLKLCHDRRKMLKLLYKIYLFKNYLGIWCSPFNGQAVGLKGEFCCWCSGNFSYTTLVPWSQDTLSLGQTCCPISFLANSALQVLHCTGTLRHPCSWAATCSKVNWVEQRLQLEANVFAMFWRL